MIYYLPSLQLGQLWRSFLYLVKLVICCLWNCLQNQPEKATEERQSVSLGKNVLKQWRQILKNWNGIGKQTFICKENSVIFTRQVIHRVGGLETTTVHHGGFTSTRFLSMLYKTKSIAHWCQTLQKPRYMQTSLSLQNAFSTKWKQIYENREKKFRTRAHLTVANVVTETHCFLSALRAVFFLNIACCPL